MCAFFPAFMNSSFFPSCFLPSADQCKLCMPDTAPVLIRIIIPSPCPACVTVALCLPSFLVFVMPPAQLFFCPPAFSSSAFSCTEKSSLVSSSSQLSSHRCVAPACEPTSSSLVQSVA